MRNKKIAGYLCMALLLMTVGCSNSTADLEVSTADTINFNDVIDSSTEESSSSYQSDNESVDNQQDSHKESYSGSSNGETNTTQLQSKNEQSQSDSELDGNIESIGDNRVVINKIIHTSADTAISYCEDSEKVLVTVYFSEETEFEVQTVRNGGVNGDSDIERQQGAFSDLKQGATINITGNYEGNDFHANHVIIYNFV